LLNELHDVVEKIRHEARELVQQILDHSADERYPAERV
jgi:hypothetical protein